MSSEWSLSLSLSVSLKFPHLSPQCSPPLYVPHAPHVILLNLITQIAALILLYVTGLYLYVILKK